MSSSDFKAPTSDDRTETSILTHSNKIVRQKRLKRFTPVKDIRARYKSFRIKKKK